MNGPGPGAHRSGLITGFYTAHYIVGIFVTGEGPIRRTREGRSEWEPIKFFSKEMETPIR
jgi:hypothetical protein